MSNLVERAGQVVIRLGGNTQEFATLVPELPDGRTFGKEESGSRQTVRAFYNYPGVHHDNFIRHGRPRYSTLSTCFT